MHPFGFMCHDKLDSDKRFPQLTTSLIVSFDQAPAADPPATRTRLNITADNTLSSFLDRCSTPALSPLPYADAGDLMRGLPFCYVLAERHSTIARRISCAILPLRYSRQDRG